MTRFIDIEAAKKLYSIPVNETYKTGEKVVGVKAVAPVKGKDQVGEVVYRQKAQYGAPFESEHKTLYK